MIKKQPDSYYDIPYAESPEPAEDAEVVEGTALESVPVSHSAESGFTHFVDGAQMARLAFYDGQYPAYLAHLSAAILERKDGEMLDVCIEKSRWAVFAPAQSEALAELAQSGFDTSPVPSLPQDGMASMQATVSNRIGTEREQIETAIRAEFVRNCPDHWLLADGGIGQVSNLVPQCTRLVGVVKSHRKQYFTNRTAETVLNLAEGERTRVFCAKTGNVGQDIVYSWYLRFRESKDESPAFGLVRVEMPPKPESIQAADTVSGWLLAERDPISLPDPRYDRMVYPIRRVEMYLKSRQPSEAAFLGAIGVFDPSI